MANAFDKFDDEQDEFSQFDAKQRQVPVTWQGKPVGSVVVDDGPRWSQLPGNIPGDALKYGVDIAKAAVHPKRTADALGGLLAGGVTKMIPGEQAPDKQFDVFWDDIVSHYGSMENIKKSMIEEPVRTLADIVSIVMPAGKAASIAGTATKSAKIAQIGDKIYRVSSAAEPAAIARELIMKGAKKISPSANRMYASAAKFSSKLGIKENERLAEIALKNDIMPTMQGYLKADRTQKALRDEVSGMIADYEKANPVRLYLDDLFMGLQELKERAAITGNQRYIEAIQKKLIKGNYGKLSPGSGKIALKPSEVQRLKIDLNSENQSYFNKMAQQPIAKKAKAKIAQNAKETLEYLMPEIKELNAKQSDMIALRKAIEQSAQRIRKRDIMGIGVPLKGSTGALLGQTAGAAVGVTLGILDTPSVKARLSRIFHKLETRGIKLSPRSAAFKLALYQSEEHVQRFGGGEGFEKTVPKITYEEVGDITEDDLEKLFKNRRK